MEVIDEGLLEQNDGSRRQTKEQLILQILVNSIPFTGVSWAPLGPHAQPECRLHLFMSTQGWQPEEFRMVEQGVA